jgi:hypothetical protein
VDRPGVPWTDIASGTPKTAWHDVPVQVRQEIERALGSRVADASTQAGGFTPGCAARLRLADGERAFVKGVAETASPDAARMHRREAQITAVLKAVPQVPRLLTSLELDGWVCLLFEDIDGRHPSLPWDDGELDVVLAGIRRLSSQLTPSPVDGAPIGPRMRKLFSGWARLRDNPGLAGALADHWVTDHLDELAAWEAGWAHAADGDTLLHTDLRADQILLTDERVMFVDWPHASVGAAWLDVLLMAPSITVQGGPGPGEVLERSGATAGVPDEDLTAVAVALAGFFLASCLQPPPPGLPTVRAFQRAQGEALLPWLRTRLAEHD